MTVERRNRRVVVTGIGAITPIGIGAGGLWQGVLRGQSAVRRISRFNPEPFATQIAAEVTDFKPEDYFEGRALKRLDRCSQFAVAASRLALEDGRLDLRGDYLPDRVAVCIGSALGGAAFAEEQHERYVRGGVRSVNPALALQMFVGAGSCNVSIDLGVTGYLSSNADSCASGTIAIGNGCSVIQRGEADMALAGGAEAPLAPLCFGAFALIRAMSAQNDRPETACRPFDRLRDGFVMGEGAAVLALEELQHARRRKARIYAEIAGFACTSDAHHMTAPRPGSGPAAECVRRALQSAGASASEVDYINAHGSSTPLNDAAETVAIKLALGEDAARSVPISGTKPLYGHSLGASGAIEAAICCLAIRNSLIPGTLNYCNADPECDLDYVPGAARSADLQLVISNSFGFGGINSVLALRKCRE
ncbi:MAG TPA: beta-ketoacyl-ACP synthase II [Chthonomonadales bacterium]|nr:beta-ketoacyl-ACP synthase II [Chthonomonadales bacterium]